MITEKLYGPRTDQLKAIGYKMAHLTERDIINLGMNNSEDVAKTIQRWLEVQPKHTSNVKDIRAMWASMAATAAWELRVPKDAWELWDRRNCMITHYARTVCYALIFAIVYQDDLTADDLTALTGVWAVVIGTTGLEK